MAGLSFDEMVDMPLDSSPLKEPPATTVTAMGSSLSRSESPSPLSTAMISGRKRPAEDLSQFANEISRAHKLAKPDHDELAKFSQVNTLLQYTTTLIYPIE